MPGGDGEGWDGVGPGKIDGSEGWEGGISLNLCHSLLFLFLFTVEYVPASVFGSVCGDSSVVGFDRALMALFKTCNSEDWVTLMQKPCLSRVVALYFFDLD